MRSDPRISLGLGGMLPAARTRRLGERGVRCNTSLSVARPESTSVSAGATRESHRLGHHGSAQISVYQDHRPAARRESQGEVAGDRRFAVARQRTRDDDRPRRMVDVHELEVRPKCAKRLRHGETAALLLAGTRLQQSTLCVETVSDRDASDHRNARLRLDIVSARTRRSDTVRIRANAIPNPSPRIPPTSRAVWTFGKMGSLGSEAASPGMIVTGDEPGVPSPSNCRSPWTSIESTSRRDHGFDRRRAVAVTRRMTVSGVIRDGDSGHECLGWCPDPVHLSSARRPLASRRYRGTTPPSSERGNLPRSTSRRPPPGARRRSHLRMPHRQGLQQRPPVADADSEDDHEHDRDPMPA